MCNPGRVSPGAGDEQLFPRRELARRAGVSEGTLRNWETGQDPPLRTRRGTGRTVTSTLADLRAFCAAHPELPAAGRAAAHLNSPTASLDIASLRSVLEAVLAAVRATTAAHRELADNSAVMCRDHSAALNSALQRLDHAVTRIFPIPPEPR